MRAKRAEITQQPASRRPPKTDIKQALFKNLDVRELSLALHKARVNADFPLIEEYCQWVAKTARIDLFRLFV
ncbi:hypothetical protein COT42_07100 [Candidatus Saganbacteria bacterium CG08_land_8_20_14_0_20_45_16]|uniref:Uncharacterized protein n=1 Tax=Candidatus Saganbacteria bacterium CG08_land_8_20_14_0_20_45_16 TaxID=2014293 RepID=A0A2H0XV61_UNCSA|nr:MAG: hypothetical protein COT42_07100 [Candidatus Saganbacteria bacterium CG08_land_8_20_14_0_20_45_16]